MILEWIYEFFFWNLWVLFFIEICECYDDSKDFFFFKGTKRKLTNLSLYLKKFEWWNMRYFCVDLELIQIL